MSGIHLNIRGSLRWGLRDYAGDESQCGGPSDHEEQQGPETTVLGAGRDLWSALSVLGGVQVSQCSQVLKRNWKAGPL